MKTDELILALSADAPPVKPLLGTLTLGLLPAVVIGLIGVATQLGVRPDIVAAFADPVAALRHVLTLSLFGIALGACFTLARPEGVARLWPLAVLGAVAVAVALWAYVTLPPGARSMAMYGKTMIPCLVTIPVISALPVAAIFAMLRRGAVTRPALAGAMAGLAGGGIGAAIYALHCTEDSPLFYVTWYGLAILAVTATSALVGSRLLRW